MLGQIQGLIEQSDYPKWPQINCKCYAASPVSIIQLPVASAYLSSILIEKGSEHEGRNCIDGDEKTGCHSVFRDDPFPWIVLDFGTEVDVSKVEIINGKETKSNIQVHVSNQYPFSVEEFHAYGTLLGSLDGPFVDGQKLSISREVTTSGGKFLERQVQNLNRSSRSEQQCQRQICDCSD